MNPPLFRRLLLGALVRIELDCECSQAFLETGFSQTYQWGAPLIEDLFGSTLPPVQIALSGVSRQFRAPAAAVDVVLLSRSLG